MVNDRQSRSESQGRRRWASIPRDQIVTHAGERFEKYGCALYTAVALSALLDVDDTIVPISHVRRQDEGPIKEILGSFPNVDTSGITSQGDHDPKQAALAAGISTGLGAIVPVIPFIFTTGTVAIVTAAVISLLAHFLVGAAKSLVTLRTWWSAGLEMTLAGVIVGGATYLVRPRAPDLTPRDLPGAPRPTCRLARPSGRESPAFSQAMSSTASGQLQTGAALTISNEDRILSGRNSRQRRLRQFSTMIRTVEMPITPRPVAFR